MNAQALFEKVVELCGVSTVLAPGLVRRALLDGKVHVEDATVDDYRAALPRLLARLRAYVPEDEAQRRARRIAALLQSLDPGSREATEGEGTRTGTLPRRATPASGSTRLPPSSGELPVPDCDGDELTVHGRRFTAHELEVLRAAGARMAEASPAERSEPAESGETDLRTTRR